LAVPWVERYSRATLLMEAFVVKLLHACPTPKAFANSRGLHGAPSTASW
jgi:hypothetical protein